MLSRSASFVPFGSSESLLSNSTPRVFTTSFSLIRWLIYGLGGRPAHLNAHQTRSYVRILFLFATRTNKSSIEQPKRHLLSVCELLSCNLSFSICHALESKTSPYMVRETFTERDHALERVTSRGHHFVLCFPVYIGGSPKTCVGLLVGASSDRNCRCPASL